MNEHEKLPVELVWSDDSHVTDEVLMAVADGERGIIPDDALVHLDGCESCSQRLGQAAMLSLQSQQWLAQYTQEQPAPEAITQRPGLPWKLLAAALLLAVVGMVPALVQLPSWLVGTVHGLWQLGPAVLRGVALAMRTVPTSLGAAVPLASAGASLVLVMTGIGVARTWSRRLPLEGGVG